MNTKKQCTHCLSDIDTRNYARHVDSCLLNPAIIEKTRAFMLSLSKDGIAPTMSMYQREYQGKAPAPSFIQKYFASWGDFCASFGLESPLPLTRKHAQDRGKWKAVIAAVDADSAAARAAERDAFDWRKMPCIARGPRTYYDWRTRQYRTDEVMELR